MKVAIVTLFPDMFTAVTDYGITGRACRNGLLDLKCWNPRDFTTDRHRTVDDKPFGGGAGMLMKTEPLCQAIDAATAWHDSRPTVIYLSPQGRRLDQAGVESLAGRTNLILVCGRYQGIDERVLQTRIDEEWSVGDYVLSGGELPAMVMLDAVIRYLPGALGNEDSAGLDSFAAVEGGAGLLDCPRYTRPQAFAGMDVPAVLTGGNHQEIRRWQLKQRLGRTWLKRPDLLESRQLTDEQRVLLNEFISESGA
ncbi:tRNA (guanosine(37)-N1)-methyltransferase TrmD [Pseudohongiella sp. SYSU M77423]|uniref:tRNA (guanosine(37)-N1)-methyltransferase TrmD n=1 Tax=unclassified Pseudohongiella TaxID=2629611 RepID=UPI000C98C399|nr:MULTISPECIES: tRNA (guanosine(37)-N1)-methyltransferase TrmD [unclassified Pseudohongiella]MAO41078.1 tRNA (guanosine(37)-N1)-methyltransferase TrmD [Pseudohongiella sp.]MAY54502.1 tRNA (guanosine(37)-N1)-methyltransferase TrmD [Gammaproteobacteria bacterium]MDH7943498.1 tRNA (guanosine(37)-N1)-methyltransferase TrmD [Pseudohongiella sp. SYSU M77423]MEC8859594.1 tRNA (guanosine(37)-N1)-methyltransferase TrmD [Pseudomonadota bacterium]|tara:strand:- start:1334 stop:2089 length:756 start_codon:yes stop_codon:yes gene_type:complete